MTIRFPAVLAVSAALVSLPATAQTPRPTPRPPVFEAGIEVINLNVSITDARGQYITGLTREDFAVFEDGVKQELSIFAHENQIGRASCRERVSPRV